jgi:uncharacterized protein DUF2752
MLKRQLFTPVIASVMRRRTEALAISGAAVIQGSLMAMGLPGWPCPVRHALGIPCPGCGLTRATAALLHGDWHTSLGLHAFAPLFMLALALVAVSSLLPDTPRRSLISAIETIEHRTGISAILLTGVLFYWLIRLLLYPETARLIAR